MTDEERGDAARISAAARVYRHGSLVSPGATANTSIPLEFEGLQFHPGITRHWKTTADGLRRLNCAGRLAAPSERSVAYVRFLEDFAARELTNVWGDTQTGAFTDAKVYAVQTNTKVITRCVLMTTDPGDLVLDPTAGSGTAAYVAEQWGRRWITIDTSRVAVAIARQRLLTAKYEYFRLKDESKGVAGGFRYKIVPHVTLKSIAQNANLDPIFSKHQPILEEKLHAANSALWRLTEKSRQELATKLLRKQKQEGRTSINDADRRRWELPAKGKGWQHWNLPFDTDSDYPADLKAAIEEYRATLRAKMDEVNALHSRER